MQTLTDLLKQAEKEGALQDSLAQEVREQERLARQRNSYKPCSSFIEDVKATAKRLLQKHSNMMQECQSSDSEVGWHKKLESSRELPIFHLGKGYSDDREMPVKAQCFKEGIIKQYGGSEGKVFLVTLERLKKFKRV